MRALVITAAAVVVLGVMYFRHRGEKMKVVLREGGVASRIAALAGMEGRIFSPAFLFTNPHAQILLLRLLYVFHIWPKVLFVKETLLVHGQGRETVIINEEEEMRKEHDVISLDWNYHPDHPDHPYRSPSALREGEWNEKSHVIILMLHGVTGNSKEFASLVKRIRDTTKWTCVILNRRGHCYFEGLKQPTFNVMGSSHDLRVAVRHIRSRYPDAKLALVGSSAGSGLLTRYLGEEGMIEGNKQEIFTAVALSPGYDISVAFPRVKFPYNSLLTWRLIRYFVERNEETLLKYPHPIAKEKIEALKKAKTVDEFTFHAALFGLPPHLLNEEIAKDPEQLYRKYLQHSCPMQVVTNIKVPTMIINSLDDPLCVGENVTEFGLPLTQYENCCLVITEKGSHVCFIEQGDGYFKYEMFAEKLAVDWITASLALTTNSA